MNQGIGYKNILRGFTLSDQSITNYLTLLLNFSNIFFLVYIPLMFRDNAVIIQALPLVGFSGIAIIFLVLFSNRFSLFLTKRIWIVNILCSIFLLLMFTNLVSTTSAIFYYLFAANLGISQVGTEVASLRLAVGHTERTSLHKNISIFNALRVFGISIGSMIAGFIGGSGIILLFARAVIIFVSLCIIILSSIAMLRFQVSRVFHSDSDQSESSRDVKKSLSGIILFLIDQTIFTFWYTFIPIKLSTGWQLSKEFVGTLIAFQGLSHGIGQLIWRRLIVYLGDIQTFVISECAHLTMMFIIAGTAHHTPTQLIVLFLMLGLANSGTFLGATAWYYSSGFPTSKFSRIAIHRLASNGGKWIGAVLFLLYTR